MPLKLIRKRIKNTSLSPTYGVVKSINANAIIATGLKVSIGQSVTIVTGEEKRLGMVTSLGADSFTITPFGFVEGMQVGDKVLLNRNGLDIPGDGHLVVHQF